MGYEPSYKPMNNEEIEEARTMSEQASKEGRSWYAALDMCRLVATIRALQAENTRLCQQLNELSRTQPPTDGDGGKDAEATTPA